MQWEPVAIKPNSTVLFMATFTGTLRCKVTFKLPGGNAPWYDSGDGQYTLPFKHVNTTSSVQIAEIGIEYLNDTGQWTPTRIAPLTSIAGGRLMEFGYRPVPMPQGRGPDPVAAFILVWDWYGDNAPVNLTALAKPSATT